MNDWIKNLKVGDKVIFSRRFFESVEKVEKITPAGNIKVRNCLFNPNGTERGGDIWNKAYLYEATPDLIERIIQKNTIKKAKCLMKATTNITLEQAKGIIVLLDNSNNKTGESK